MTESQRTGRNNLNITVYSSGTTPLVDTSHKLVQAENIQFTTGYPGGLYLDGNFYISHNILDWIGIKGSQRVVIRNDHTVVYEGYIADIIDEMASTDQGYTVNLIGGWSHILMNRRWRKRWADDRVDNFTWEWAPPPTTTSNQVGETMCNLSRLTDAGPAILFSPTSEAAWADGDLAYVTYTMPGGETVKRITYDYDLQEGGQAWEINARRSTDGSSYTMIDEANGDTIAGAGTTTQITSSGTGSIDATLGTASQYVQLRFYSRAAQTPTGDGSEYAEFSDIKVFSETDAEINMEVIAEDVIAGLSELNSDTSKVDTPSTTLELVPFMADNFETSAWILDEITRRGDGDYNAWAAQLLHSESIASPNGEPVLEVSQYPSTTVPTNYEYIIRLDDKNIEPPLSIAEDTDAIINYVVMRYTDGAGRAYYRTPGNNASLKDQDSIDAYGQKEGFFDLGPSTQAIVDAVGQKILAQKKDPQYRIDGPITVKGYIQGKKRGKVPASEIVAGDRLKIANYLEDRPFAPAARGTTPPAGAGLQLIITRTRYDDETETCQIYCGKLDTLIFPQMVFKPIGMAPGPRDGGGGNGSGSGGDGNTNWKRVWDYPKELWGSWTQADKQAWIAKKKAERKAKG